MNLREIVEQNEMKNLSEFAQKSVNSKGRVVEEEECNIRTCYQRDRDRIIHSKAFRRLSHKTQVFILPHSDHFRTRLSHTLEVSQIARTVARALNLNEDLTEAIALGHDLGHTPFGHIGEAALSKVRNKTFDHNVQSVRIVEKIERDGKGLNLSFETLDGMLNHRGHGNPLTLEGQVVQISDKIAYINHDIEDALRSELISVEELPQKIIEKGFDNSSKRINYFVSDIIENSYNKNEVKLSEETKEDLYELRDFLFKRVYKNEKLLRDNSKVLHMFNDFYSYFSENIKQLPKEYIEMIKNNSSIDDVICDYIVGMTDRYAINLYSSMFLPKSWKI